MKTTIIAAALLLASFAPTHAQTVDGDNFASPSRNIYCNYFKGDGPPSVRCDLMQVSNRQPPRPRDCDLEYGRSFEVTANATKAMRICVGDTVADPGVRVLPYGQTWQKDGFTCYSAESGMTCRNNRGAGFELSRAAQKIF
ncbi:hypothetical protein GJW-30_1_03249 [Variibacter gotjawalensis]|uniref:Uncharacterized protein n=1 Tax=Variibacter gotjawalensis TaxID=1333996 RepID=A0A0S3PXM1_9BRAD|nr:DUF6636 domain-containing protein [Variibacter gotjawalensis]NIK46534.1 hypothetical protein [Variibacter gotjawalensis]RZS48439.1 hypothetical protein EV661_0852 [Variibacter gotjawalensis]BAT60700.1 hypothetical protein GJW-30_1_03249 [Variibacter gotjawalensis]